MASLSKSHRAHGTHTKNYLGLAALLMFVMLLAACAPAAGVQEPEVVQPAATEVPAAMPTATEPAVAPAATPEMTAVPMASAAALSLGENAELGQFLVDAEGRTLYLFTQDTPDTSTCYDQCAQNWPPLLTEGEPVAGDGVDASLLGTAERTDGTTQVTYNGWPLYYFARDQQPGDTTGQGRNDVWFVISPAGEKVETQAGAATPTAESSSGPQAVEVPIRGFEFAPKELTVAVGTTVTWINEDGSPHTVTSDTDVFDSGNMNQGDEFSFTFSEPGTYPYFCLYHGSKGGQGMAGTVIVQ